MISEAVRSATPRHPDAVSRHPVSGDRMSAESITLTYFRDASVDTQNRPLMDT